MGGRKGVGAFIGLVPMLAIYVEHLLRCSADVSSRDRSNNARDLRQRSETNDSLPKRNEESISVVSC